MFNGVPFMIKVNPYEVSTADLVVGIPSYNEADNIAFVVNQVNKGLLNYFPHLKSIVVNVDNNSPDNTKDSFFSATNSIPKMYISTPEGIKGKGNNFYNLFKEAVNLGAKAVVVVDADLTSITAEWIKEFADPILNKGFDFASPLYSRNEYDGNITNHVCYPLLFGLLGRDMRQPIGGDFAFSGKLAKYYLLQQWSKTTGQYGIDIFMSLNALLGGFKNCQVGLGAKMHKPSVPKLGPMFTQMVGTLFRTLLSHKSKWMNVCSLEETPQFGSDEFVKPQNFSIDYKGMKATALYEFQINSELISENLNSGIYKRLSQMYETGKLNIGVDLWTRIIYDLLYAYDISDGDPDLVEAMKSLYFGRLVSFYRRTMEMDHKECEQEIQRQARYFFKMRKYLVKKYGTQKTSSNP